MRSPRPTRPRVLVLTAPVGGGHDAAARAVASELEAAGYDVHIEDALLRAGRWVEWLVVHGYRFQLERAPFTYELLYRALGHRLASRLVKGLCALVGARRIHRLLDEVRPVLVVTTYPLAGAMLSRLRRQGKLRVPAAALVTDLAPHPMWCYPRLDAHLAMHETSAGDMSRLAGGGIRVVRPPVDPRFGTVPRQPARSGLGLSPSDRAVLVVGGAWGTGRLDRTVACCAAAGWRPVVVCGRNEALRKRLEVASPPGTIVLGFTDDMPSVMAACDAIVVNAPGLTCLEAFASGLPVVVHDPIPGHGVHNARYMEELGLVRFARTPAALEAVLGEIAVSPPLLRVARARRMFDAPSLVTALGGIAAPRATRHRRVAGAVLVASLVPVLATTRVGVAETGELLHRRMVEPGGGVPDVALCLRLGTSPGPTGAVLRLLRRFRAHATFFVSAEQAARHPDLLREIAAAGHEIGNGGSRWTVGRRYLPRLARRTESEGAAEIRKAAGVDVRYFLPATGRLTVPQALATSSEVPVVGATSATPRRLRHLRRGEIVLIDLSSGDATALLSDLLRQARLSGYAVVDLSELVGARAHT